MRVSIVMRSYSLKITGYKSDLLLNRKVIVVCSENKTKQINYFFKKVEVLDFLPGDA